MPRLRIPSISASDPPEEDGGDAAPRRRPPPAWGDLLNAAARAEQRGERQPREIFYAVDVDASRDHGAVVVALYEAAAWLPEQFRAATVHRYELAQLDTADAALLGGLEALGAGPYGIGTAGPAFAARFVLPAEAALEILPEICWTGRARVTRGMQGLDGPPLEWDAGGAYALVLEAAMDAHGTLSVGAFFARDQERVSVHTPALVTASGLAFFKERVAYVEDFGAFGWIASIRESGRIPLGQGDVGALVEGLLKMARAPRLELPPEHAFAEARVPMRPCAVLRSPTGVDDFAKVAAWAEYDGVHVLLAQPGRVLVDRVRRRLVARDARAEEEARGKLESCGVRRERANDGGWQRLARTRLGAALRALAFAGFRVELDGRAWRASAELSFAVSTGIDWFDVRVKGDFDGIELPLPELLAAAKQRRTTVILADGSTGVLREEWLERVDRWAAMATPEDGALRFGKTQVGVLAALADREPSFAQDEAFAKQRAELAAFWERAGDAPPKGVEPKDAPYGFRGALRPYQREALGWFDFLRRFGLGGCLADDMGLGKTVQVVALLEERRQEESRPQEERASLVVAPRSLVFHWAAEIARFAPELRVHVHDGADRQLGPDQSKHDVVITTYGILRRDADALAAIAWDYVVLDEATAIKNGKSSAAVAARSLKARHRLALTGTPVENHLGELASILAFVNPGMLGSSRALSELTGRHVSGSPRAGSTPGNGRALDAAARSILAQALRPVVLRRTKGQVARDLPDRVEQTIICDLGRDERRLYGELRAKARASLGARSTMHVLEALLRLRQAACHPGLVDAARRTEPSAKLEALIQHLESVRAEGRKALVFSQFATLQQVRPCIT